MFALAGVLVVSVLGAYFLVPLSLRRLQLGRLRRLHADQPGGVQSLSFVLTLPMFIMVMLLIVQVSQVDDRPDRGPLRGLRGGPGAMVWIPAELGAIDAGEGPNCIS